MVLWRSAESISRNRSKRGGSEHYNKSLCCHYLFFLSLSPIHYLHFRSNIPFLYCAVFVHLSFSPSLPSSSPLLAFSLIPPCSSQRFCVSRFSTTGLIKQNGNLTQTWGGARFCISTLFIRTLAHMELRVYAQIELVFIILPFSHLCSPKIFATAARHSCLSFPPDRWRTDRVWYCILLSNLVGD